MAVGCKKITVGETFLVVACVTFAAGCRMFLEFNPLYVSITSNGVQSNTTCLTNIFINLRLQEKRGWKEYKQP